MINELSLEGSVKKIVRSILSHWQYIFVTYNNPKSAFEKIYHKLGQLSHVIVTKKNRDISYTSDPKLQGDVSVNKEKEGPPSNCCQKTDFITYINPWWTNYLIIKKECQNYLKPGEKPLQISCYYPIKSRLTILNHCKWCYKNLSVSWDWLSKAIKKAIKQER